MEGRLAVYEVTSRGDGLVCLHHIGRGISSSSLWVDLWLSIFLGLDFFSSDDCSLDNRVFVFFFS
jgi:hypothetical protein